MKALETSFTPFARDIPRYPRHFDVAEASYTSQESSPVEIPTPRTSVLFQEVLGISRRDLTTSSFKITFGENSDEDGSQDPKEKPLKLKQEEDLMHQIAAQATTYVQQRQRSGRALDRTQLSQEQSLNMQLASIAGDHLVQSQRVSLSEQGRDFKAIVHLASKLWFADALNIRMQELEERSSENESFYKLLDLQKHISAAPANTKFAGISLSELVSQWPARQVSLTQALDFFIAAYEIPDQENYETCISDNRDIYTQFPEVTKDVIHDAGVNIELLLCSANGFTSEDFKISEKTYRPLSKWATTLIKTVNEIQSELIKSLLNPDSPDFVPLKQRFQEYMIKGKLSEIWGLSSLGITKELTLVDFYRKVKNLSLIGDENSSFFRELSDSVKDYVIEIPNEVGILSSDDLVTILNNDMVPNQEDENTFNEVVYRTLHREINPTAMHNTFNVQIPEIDWGNLNPPTEAAVEFNKANLSDMHLFLTYRNEEGEATNVRISVGKNKGLTRWGLNFLEDDQEIPEIYKAGQLVTKNILEHIAQSRRKTPNGSPRTIVPVVTNPDYRKKTIYIDDSPEPRTYPLPIKIRKSQDGDSTLAQASVTSEQTGDYRLQMVVFEENKAKINKQMSRMSSEDQINAADALRAFNEQGIGKFYELKGTDPIDGERLYVLRAKAKVKGDTRILAKRVPGTNDFSVIAVGYRKDIFRDFGV